MAAFADRFKALRNKRGLTQDEIAELLDVSRSTIAGYESATKGRVPRREMLNKIANIFEVPIDYLLGRTDSPSDDPSIRNVDSDQVAFLKWVEENLEGTFYYDFNKSPDDAKKHMMETLRLVWEREKGRKPGQKQGE